jgi:hypothetical protein
MKNIDFSTLKQIFGRIDKVGLQSDLLNNSSITFLGMGKEGGQECYKVGLRKDTAAYSKIISEQMGRFPAG